MRLLYQQLFELIRCSLIDKKIDSTLFANMQDPDWENLKELAGRQGVSAIVLDGIHKAGLKPPLELLLEWIGISEYIRCHYDDYIRGVKSFLNFISGHGVKVLVLKGISLACYYPEPKHREFGDFDIYTFNSHNLINDIIKKNGILIKYDNTHDEFDYNNIHIEHHNYFVSNYSKVSRKVNEYLQLISNNDIGKVVDGLYYPTPDFNVIYLLRHISKHLTGEGVTLRQIIDWGLFLDKEGDNINWDVAAPIIKDCKMDVVFNVITAISEQVLSLNLLHYYIGSVNNQLVDKTMNFILSTRLHQESDLCLPKRVLMKTKRFFSHYWMYQTGLIPDRFLTEYFWWSFREHLNDPSQI